MNRNKKKSNKHSAPPTAPPKTPTRVDSDFPKRVLEENTKKFVPSSDSEEDEPPDFDYLLKLPPTSIDSHFFTKSEQLKYNENTMEIDGSKYFNLNTKILNAALESIPFNEKHEIDVEWGLGELITMKEEAAVSECRYKELLDKNINQDKVKPLPETLVSGVEMVKVTEEAKTKPVIDGGTAKTSNLEIQQWLDDILDI